MQKISMKPLCVIRAPVECRAGYGDMARDIVRHMIEYNKYEVKVHGTPWGETPMDALDPTSDHDKMVLDAIIREPLARKPDLFICISIPSEFYPVGAYNIGITAGIETTLPDLSWVEGCNRMDTVWFTSTFSKEVFENVIYNKTDNNGNTLGHVKLQVPVDVLHNCVNTKVFKKLTNESDMEKSIRKMMDEIPEKFNFLFVGHWLHGDMGEDRKNVGLLIKIFLETFRQAPGEHPGLILKTSGAGFSVIDQEELLRKVEMIKASVKLDEGQTLPNVYIIHGELSESELNSLYNHPKVKVHVSLTKGEGFGRPLLEASMSGKPIIASGWSGHVDFLDKETSILIGGETKKVHPSAQVPGILLSEALWFSPDINQAANALYGATVEYSTYKKISAPVMARNRTNFNYEAIKKQMHSLLDKYLPPVRTVTELKLPTLKKVAPKEI